MANNVETQHDTDPAETQEWLEAIDSVKECEGNERARYLLTRLYEHAAIKSVLPTIRSTPYINTIAPEQQADLPDQSPYFEILTNIMRWNAIMMVMRSGQQASELGGHIATYASIAILYEVGLQYFFHARNQDHGGDLVYFQGHSSPGIYARAFLEDRLDEEHLEGFRQEALSKGISSYPHPWLMPDFWQFPTVSMGLGPLMGIYQAQFLQYLQNRGLAETTGRKVWVFCGDGETGEPESLGAINIAGREQLDRLIFVINCNLQRLDGPVFGNGQIIQELDALYRGAGWHVIKIILNSAWDELLAKDTQGFLLKRLSELVDGEQQVYESRDVAYFREHFFGKYPELMALIADYTDEQLRQLGSGGHDLRKVYAAYQAAVSHRGQPTVILAKTVKGYGMGSSGEAMNIAHNAKKMKHEDLQVFAKRFKLPLSDEQVKTLAYYRPAKNSPEMQYLLQSREKLGGFLPARQVNIPGLEIPDLSLLASQLGSTGDREISTTMSFVRILAALLKEKSLAQFIVPILADESRTFGMEGLFRQIGIYSPFGQRYQPEDHKQLMFYREDQQGQLLQQGISEAGAMASWIAAATSYANNQVMMIPFFIYYSMFGYQRFGDLVWAAADSRARGFLLGGTAGRTTLAGEGLQHQDGHNLLMFSFVPNCRSYDPCFAYELAVIIHDGLRRMYQQQEDVFYYITLMNENYTHPAMPENAEEGIIKGMYLLKESTSVNSRHVQLLGSGTILREVMSAAELLEQKFSVAVDVWSVTSFNELRRDLLSVERHHRLHPEDQSKKSYINNCLDNRLGPVIAATDYIKLYADQIRSAIKQPYYVLGTDGFGRSDTRVALRDFFEVNAAMIAYSALKALFDQDQFSIDELTHALHELKIDPTRCDPVTV